MMDRKERDDVFVTLYNLLSEKVPEPLSLTPRQKYVVTELVSDYINEREGETAVPDPQEGDIALVTTRSGKQYVGVWTLAPGIDYFWSRVTNKPKINSLIDPDVSYEIIGHASV
jgi:hypothetical protein